QKRRVDPDAVHIDTLGQRDATAIEHVSALGGYLELPNVLLLGETLEVILLVPLEIHRASQNRAEAKKEGAAHHADAECHPKRPSLRARGRLVVTHQRSGTRFAVTSVASAVFCGDREATGTGVNTALGAGGPIPSFWRA